MRNIFSRQTPYDDDYGTCLETRATLRIYPGDISPNDVTARLELVPSKVNVAGEKRVSKLGHERTVEVNGWFLSSEGHVKSLDTRRHLDWLLKRIGPKSLKLEELQKTPGVQMSVNCAWYSRSGHGGPTLWPEQMEGLSALNLECTFDIYFLPDDD